jgi:hypothetical protein
VSTIDTSPVKFKKPRDVRPRLSISRSAPADSSPTHLSSPTSPTSPGAEAASPTPVLKGKGKAKENGKAKELRWGPPGAALVSRLDETTVEVEVELSIECARGAEDSTWFVKRA